MRNIKVLLLAIFAICASNGQIVDIEDGRIQGTVMQTWTGVSYDAFLRIPYAEPPVGSLRFKAPIRNRAWTGTLNGTAFGPTCMQKVMGSRVNPMSEDCLHLNVFTKSLGSSILRPVILYIHGGAYEIGSGTSSNNPLYIMDRDIVLVTINYRLNSFGFLALGTKDAVGNMALKDQAMAIQWVQSNIAHFGGDPNSVTLFGMSAGGHSVTAHMVSEMSKNRFHRVISMSGAIAWQKGLEQDNIPMATEMAQKLNCPTTNLSVMFNCIVTRNATDIVEAGLLDFHSCPVMPWVPVLEPDLGQERFFLDDPNRLFRAGYFARVPVITGIVADEFISPVRHLLYNEDSLQQLNHNFTKFAPTCFFFGSNNIRSSAEIAMILKERYLPFRTIDRRAFNSLNMLLADGVISYGVHRFAHFISEFTDVYYYKFDYIGRFTFFRFPRDFPYGVHHGDEGQYVLGSFIGLIQRNDPEMFMVERMTKIFEQFARTGNPNNQDDEVLSNMIWPTLNRTDEYFLDIGLNMVEKQGLYLERFQIWDDLERL